MADYITIQGKQIPYTRGSVSVPQCVLDPRNPRIQYMIGQRADLVSENELDALVWEKDAVKALAQSIYQNGGVYEHIIVQRKGDKYLVREGNCRTVADRHLGEQYPDDARFQTMPAMIFDADLTEEDLAVLLADMHVAGKIQWDAYEQAKQVFDLFNLYGKTYDWLSNHLRLSKSKIKELLSAYQATKDYLAIHPAPANVKKFSFFHELMRKKDLKDRFQDQPEFKQKFYRWLEEGKLTDSKQVRDLPTVLQNSDAAKALETSGMPEAIRVLQTNDPSLESDLFWAVKEATAKIKQAPMSDVQDLQSGSPQKLIMLRNLHRAIEDLATIAQVKL
jgi:hypothetical protein